MRSVDDCRGYSWTRAIRCRPAIPHEVLSDGELADLLEALGVLGS